MPSLSSSGLPLIMTQARRERHLRLRLFLEEGSVVEGAAAAAAPALRQPLRLKLASQLLDVGEADVGVDEVGPRRQLRRLRKTRRRKAQDRIRLTPRVHLIRTAIES